MELKIENHQDEIVALGHAAATVMARAIARGIWEAQVLPGDFAPTFRSYYGI